MINVSVALEGYESGGNGQENSETSSKDGDIDIFLIRWAPINAHISLPLWYKLRHIN